MVRQDESGFNRFADAIYAKLHEVPKNTNQLFIYNQNRICEAGMFRVWSCATELDESAKNILVTSDYPNYNGLLAVHPDRHLSSKADFVFAYGAEPNKAAFGVAVLTHADPASSADLILPMPTYQDIEATALANDAFVCRYGNPTRSDIFNQLMKLFYEQGWIHPNTAEINHWNSAAEELLSKLQNHVPQCFDKLKIDLDKLEPETENAKGILYMKIEELYNSRNAESGFGN